MYYYAHLGIWQRAGKGAELRRTTFSYLRKMFSKRRARAYHFSATVEGELVVWGGLVQNFSEKRVLASCVHRFNPVQESWAEQKCSGPPPPGLCGGACASVGHHLYVYGGEDGEEWHCSLHQLDARSMTWKQLSSAGPSRKEGCRMVPYGTSLVLFGGFGRSSGLTQSGSQWDGSYSNELHTFEMEEGEGVQLTEMELSPGFDFMKAWGRGY